MNKLWLAMLLSLVVAVSVWFMLPGAPEPSATSGNAAAVSGGADAADDAPDAEAAGSAANPDKASPFALNVDEAPAAGDQDTAVNTESPAETARPLNEATAGNNGVGSPAPDAPAAADTAAGAGSSTAAADSDTQAESGAGESSRSGPVIEVPDSYPVTEAERYFVPKEERRAGNLGGPPPLNFPGGPSDPNRSVDSGASTGPGDGDDFAPPPAPQ